MRTDEWTILSLSLDVVVIIVQGPCLPSERACCRRAEGSLGGFCRARNGGRLIDQTAIATLPASYWLDSRPTPGHGSRGGSSRRRLAVRGTHRLLFHVLHQACASEQPRFVCVFVSRIVHDRRQTLKKKRRGVTIALSRRPTSSVLVQHCFRKDKELPEVDHCLIIQYFSSLVQGFKCASLDSDNGTC